MKREALIYIAALAMAVGILVSTAGAFGLGQGAIQGADNVSVEQARLSATTTCTKTISGTVIADIIVPRGTTTCFRNLYLDGSVTVARGGALAIANSVISGGPISSLGASALTICNSIIVPSLQVQGSTGFVQIGDGGDGPTPGCGGSIFVGRVLLSNNLGGVQFGGNDARDSLYLVRNFVSTEIVANRIGVDLVCQLNAPAPTNDGHSNLVIGSRIGQAVCKSPGF
jgi:hypothetical protein